MLLSENGIWEDVQICSQKMVEESQFGCMAEIAQRAETRGVGKGVSLENVTSWIDKFRKVLRDIAVESENQGFIESIKASLYYDDVMVFTPRGEALILPKGSTALDFAFELHTDIGLHAKYARINGKVTSMRTVLQRGDCVEIGTSSDFRPHPDWTDAVKTYKAKKALKAYWASVASTQQYLRCTHCHPLPGGETIGIRGEDGKITIHRRNCPEAIRLASKNGDDIVAVPFEENEENIYPVCITIKAIDRYHFLIDVVKKITDELHLSIDSLNTATHDEIADLSVVFYVHSVRELVTVMNSIYAIPGVEEVRHET